MTNISNTRLKRAMQGWWKRAERARWQYATLGRLNADGSVTVAADRNSYVWVTMNTGTLTQAYNKGNGAVPLRAGLPVRVREDGGRLIVDGEDTSGLLEGDANAPGSVYLVNDIGPDSHGNVTLSIPVKATGAEVDTGTDDAKFVTSKAMEDSAYIKAAYADAKVADAIADSVTTIAPSQNAVFDALALKQALDATLTSIAGLGTAADKMLYTTGVDTWAELATLAYGRSLLGATNIAAAQTTLALVPGTNVQAFDATLLSIAALGTAADRMLYTTGVDTWAELTTTSYGRAFLALANAAALATLMGTAAHGATLDTTPLDADEVVGMDSSASFGLIRTTWTTIKAFLLTYFSTLYAVLLGTAGGQTLNGGTAANEDLTLRGTSHATKTTSYVLLQDTGGFVGVGHATPTVPLHVASDAIFLATFETLGSTKNAVVSFVAPTGKNTNFAFFEGATLKKELRYDATANGFGIVAADEATFNLFVDDATGKVIVGLTSANASILGIKAGTSTNDAAVGGVLYVDSGSHANGTTVETDLATYTVPADTLAVNNQSLVFKAWGTGVANGNTKTVRVKFGTDSFSLFASSFGASAFKWIVNGTIIRTGAATQKVLLEVLVGSDIFLTVLVDTATRTLSGSNVLKITGQGGASSDIVQEGMKIWYDDANT